MKKHRICAAVFSAALLCAELPLCHVSAEQAAAYSTVTQNDIIYHVYSDHAVAADLNNEDIVHAVIPDTIEGVPVTVIGNSAFYMARSMRTVRIPDSVTSIGDWAFYYCDKLQSIDLPDGLISIGEFALRSCNALTEVTIPAGVTTLPRYLLAGCDSLTSFTMSDTVTKIGDRLFWYCENLQTVKLSASLTEIPGNVFCKTAITEIAIPEGVTSIGLYCFNDCDALTNIHFPSTLTTIEQSAFSDCDVLAEIDLPDSLCEVDSGAFSETPLIQTATEEAKTSDGVVYIDNTAIRFIGTLPENGTLTLREGTVTMGDHFLTSGKVIRLELPSTMRNVGAMAHSWEMLEEITVADDNPWLTLQDGILYSADMTTLLLAPAASVAGSYTIPQSVITLGKGCFREADQLTEVILPEGITEIPAYCFYGCDLLETVSMPESVTSIGYGALRDCTALRNFDLHEGITQIGGSVLQNCASLISITIPSTLEAIPIEAFSGCTSLQEADIRYGITSIGDNAFYGCTALSEARIPDSVTLMEVGAFYGSGIGTLVLSDNLTELKGTILLVEVEGSFDEEGNLIDGGYCYQEPYGLFTHAPVSSLTFSNAVTGIGDCVFSLYSSAPPVEDIYFYGSEEDWNAIEIGEDNDGLEYANVHFSAGTEGSGDANWDGALTVSDCVMLQKYLMQSGHITNKVAADLNQDGKINAFDLAVLKQKLLNT